MGRKLSWAPRVPCADLGCPEGSARSDASQHAFSAARKPPEAARARHGLPLKNMCFPPPGLFSLYLNTELLEQAQPNEGALLDGIDDGSGAHFRATPMHTPFGGASPMHPFGTPGPMSPGSSMFSPGPDASPFSGAAWSPTHEGNGGQFSPGYSPNSPSCEQSRVEPGSQLSCRLTNFGHVPTLADSPTSPSYSPTSPSCKTILIGTQTPLVYCPDSAFVLARLQIARLRPLTAQPARRTARRAQIVRGCVSN